LKFLWRARGAIDRNFKSTTLEIVCRSSYVLDIALT